MSFVPNENQQITMDDQYFSFTTREKRFLKKSWATYFADHIFPKINEERFAVLYSDNKASRPGTPVNIVVGALLLKEMRGQSDDDILESILFDYRYQYALHTSSMEEQPVSDRTLGRFRSRCLEYELKTGIDLMKEEIKALSAEMAAMMEIDGTLKRMDSLMIASNIRKLSRLELLYVCLSNFIKELHNNGMELPENLKHYTDPEDRNRVIYHNRSDETIDKIAVVLKDYRTVLNLITEDYEESSCYLLVKRVLTEQTIENEDGSLRLRTKEDGGMNAGILQNPSDPEATFREKAGKQHRGYTGNIVESVGEKGSIVTDYDLQPNTHSDQNFAREVIQDMGKQNDTVTIIADGAFGGTENIQLAKENNIDLVTTNLTGRTTDDICADFEFSEDGMEVIKCPGGYAPKSCSYNTKTGQCICSFPISQCKNCPHFSDCHPKQFKRTCRKVISANSKARALQQRFRKTDDFRSLSRIRNGVETVPSYLRRGYNIDHMPVRGTLPCKLLYGLKIGASNIKKFCKYMQSLDNCTLNPGTV